MIKYLFLLTGLLLLASGLPAQKTEFPAVVVASQGKAQYRSADKAVTLNLTPGMVLKKDGVLMLADKASTVVYCNGRLKSIQAKGNYSLANVFKSGTKSSLNFDRDFGKYVRAAVELIDVKRGGDGWGTTGADPKQGGDGWGTTGADAKPGGDGWGTTGAGPKPGGDGWGTSGADAKPGGDGWGGMGVNIVPIMPFGKLLADSVTFAWSKPAGAGAYQLEILDGNGDVLHRVTALDTFAMIDLRKLNLTPKQRYSWQVKLPDAGLSSNTRDFTVGTSADLVAAAKEATNSLVYRGGGPVLQGLMEAAALENANWYVAADRRYAGLLQKHPGDTMLRMMYAAFWMRYELERKAKAVMNP